MQMWKRAEKKIARLSEGDPVKLKLPKLIISKFKILFWVGYYRILSFKRLGRLYNFFLILGWASIGEGRLFKKLDFLSNSSLSLGAIQ